MGGFADELQSVPFEFFDIDRPHQPHGCEAPVAGL